MLQTIEMDHEEGMRRERLTWGEDAITLFLISGREILVFKAIKCEKTIRSYTSPVQSTRDIVYDSGLSVLLALKLVEFSVVRRRCPPPSNVGFSGGAVSSSGRSSLSSRARSH